MGWTPPGGIECANDWFTCLLKDQHEAWVVEVAKERLQGALESLGGWEALKCREGSLAARTGAVELIPGLDHVLRGHSCPNAGTV